jgi:DNA-binding response OmpR family regulator
MARILLVEDEVQLAELMSDWLMLSGHEVKIFTDGNAALNEIIAYKNAYEILILDIMLPGKNGLDLCKAYREAPGYAPILMVSAKRSINTKECAFKFGADDYMTKPFHLRELTMRIEALLRRVGPRESRSLRWKDVILESAEHKVVRGNKSIHLSPQEYKVLEFFFRNPNKVFSQDELRKRLWESDDVLMNDTVRGHIKRLRQKIDLKGRKSLITNVYGLGYKFEANPGDVKQN